MRYARLLPVLAAAGLVVGCTTQTVQDTRAPLTPGVGPSLVLERFLRAANANDLETMSQLFGTKDGNLLRRDDRPEVEQRMFVLASLLRHDDYQIQGTEIVPGRLREATRLMVLMTFGDRKVVVPFTMVRAGGDSWLVEQIGIERITGDVLRPGV